MDTFIVNTSNTPFFQSKIYNTNERVNFFIPNPDMMNEYCYINTNKVPTPTATTPNDPEKLSRLEKKQLKQNEKLKNAIDIILNMPDEDDTSGGKFQAKLYKTAEKEEKKEEKRVDKYEKMRLDARETALYKYQDKCDLMRKELIEKGFSEYDSKKLCSKCRYPKPYHIDYRPLVEETSFRFKQGYRFSAFCHSCINKGKAVIDNNIDAEVEIKEDKTTYYKLHALNIKCLCGAVIQILDTAKNSAALKKHVDSRRHMLWEMIKNELEYGRGGDEKNEGISFKHFSLAQLRHLIINNKKDGKSIIPYYKSKTKKQLVEALEENRQYLDIDYDILDIGDRLKEKKEKPLGSAYKEFVEKYFDKVEEEHEYNSDDSLKDTPITRYRGDDYDDFEERERDDEEREEQESD